MKRFLYSLVILIGCSVSAIAQTKVVDVMNLVFLPASVKVGSSSTASFTLANNGTADIVSPILFVTISFPESYRPDPSSIAAISPETGISKKFDWTYDASFNTLQGTFKTGQKIAAKESGQINVIVKGVSPNKDESVATTNISLMYIGDGITSNSPTASAPFAVTDVNTPVSLISFTAKPSLSSIRLDWATAHEQTNAYFEVLHSTNARDFESIGVVQGNGTTASKSVYSFTDSYPDPSSVHYYRLKQVDLDGAFTYTYVRSVKLDGYIGIQLKAFPQVNRNIRVQVEYGDMNLSGTGSLSLYDLTGRKIGSQDLSLQKGKNHVDFDTATLHPGIYLVRLEHNDQPSTVKVVLP